MARGKARLGAELKRLPHRKLVETDCYYPTPFDQSVDGQDR